jgi:site-specific recombinase XerD
MTHELITISNYQGIAALVLDGLNSEHSKRAYSKALSDFMAWYDQAKRPGLNKATVQRYKSILQDQGLAASTINQRMSAVRKLAQEAADNGLIDPLLANGISRVKGVPEDGVRVGLWLTKEQAQELLNAPDTRTVKGLRDRAILAVMLGGGLRRSEVAALRAEQVQQRDGRWVIVDLVGKRNRVRSVPIPSWTKAAIDELAAMGINGRLFISIEKGGHITGQSMTPQAIRDIVNHYGRMIGIDNLAAHDLRRTYSKLAHKGGAGLDQIQLSLGHKSIQTTERYLGVAQDLTDAPCDRLGLSLGVF